MLVADNRRLTDAFKRIFQCIIYSLSPNSDGASYRAVSVLKWKLNKKNREIVRKPFLDYQLATRRRLLCVLSYRNPVV